jgi:hypothetical protein
MTLGFTFLLLPRLVLVSKKIKKVINVHHAFYTTLTKFYTIFPKDMWVFILFFQRTCFYTIFLKDMFLYYFSQGRILYYCEKRKGLKNNISL